MIRDNDESLYSRDPSAMLHSDTEGVNMVSSRNSNVISAMPKYESQNVNRHRLLSSAEPNSTNYNYGSGASAQFTVNVQ